MKKTLLSISILITLCGGISAQNVNIPDANFKAYLLGNTAINTNSDTEIQVSEANAFTGQINCNNDGINDLTGIEAFVSLTDLRCENNNLNTLDVSQNINLTVLWCTSNNLNTLDVSQNTNLFTLGCGNQNISTLNLNQNTALTYLECFGNAINSIDITNNVDLTYIDVFNNNLNALDISQNTAITNLYCQSNDLTILNMKNINTALLTNFNATSNPNLTCIEVDDVADATANWTNIDATASFSLDCNYIVNIPDANFKAYLVGNTAINTNSDTEIQVSEAAALTGTLNCSNQNISDLTGIGAFTGISALECSGNNLTSLDLSQNTNLTSLSASTNNLTSVDISQNVNLVSISIGNNDLVSLDVSNNTALTLFFCNSNNLSSLNMKNLSPAVLNNNFFTAQNNPSLSCIEVDDITAATANWTNIDATASFSLDCGSLGINDFDLSKSVFVYPNPATSRIYIDSNEVIDSITIIDVFGKTIERNLNFNNGINVSKLSSGVYFLKVYTSKGLASKKFIKG